MRLLHTSEEAPLSGYAKRPPYWRVTDAEELTCIDPAVAVMVKLEVTGGGVELPELPPQPEIRPSPAKTATSRTIRKSRLRFLNPSRQSAMAKVAGKIGRKSWRTNAAVAGGVMVRVVVEVPPSETVMGLGLKLQE
jgi:hypothetical protein